MLEFFYEVPTFRNSILSLNFSKNWVSKLGNFEIPLLFKIKEKTILGSSIPLGSYIVYYRGDVAIFKESRPWWLVLWILVSLWNMFFLKICINNLLLPSCVDWSYQEFNLKSNKLVRGPLSQKALTTFAFHYSRWDWVHYFLIDVTHDKLGGVIENIVPQTILLCFHVNFNLKDIFAKVHSSNLWRKKIIQSLKLLATQV